MGRFSLVELVIALAILMVLAALAIPQLHTLQLRSKQAEVATMVDGITAAITGYRATYDLCPPSTGTPHPSGAGGKQLVSWLPAPVGWDRIGFRPDGAVRGIYDAGDDGFGLCYAHGLQNLDGDTVDYDVFSMLDTTARPERWSATIECYELGAPVPGPCF